MNAVRSIVLEHEGIAKDTCRQLVGQGRTFRCTRIAKGWLFEVQGEEHEQQATGLELAGEPEERVQ